MIKPGSFPGTTWSHEHHKVQTGSSPAPHSLNIPSSGTGIKPYSQLVKSPQLNPHKHPNKNCPAQKELEEPHSSLPALPLSESPSSPQILSFVADSGAGTQAQLWSHGPLRKLQSDDSPPHTHTQQDRAPKQTFRKKYPNTTHTNAVHSLHRELQSEPSTVCPGLICGLQPSLGGLGPSGATGRTLRT